MLHTKLPQFTSQNISYHFPIKCVTIIIFNKRNSNALILYNAHMQICPIISQKCLTVDLFKMDPANDIWILCLLSLEQFSPLLNIIDMLKRLYGLSCRMPHLLDYFYFFLWHHLTCSSMPFISYMLRVSFKDVNTFMLNTLVNKIV